MHNNSKVLFWGMVVTALVVESFFTFLFPNTPSNARDWKPEHERLARVKFVDDLVTIENVRSFTYAPGGEILSRAYDTRSYDTERLTGLWFVVQPFLADLLGHSIVSFEFDDGRFLALSIEARQEVGEAYSVIGGLRDEFELIYVWADERDVIGLRSHALEDNVHLYKINAPIDAIRDYFRTQLMRTEVLVDMPEFYNTITKNCTTSLFEMSNVPQLQRYSDYRVLFPGYAHRLLHELGAIDTSRPADEIYERARLDPARTTPDAADFSQAIRIP